VVDPTRAVFYTSVPSTSAVYGNSVVRIDPAAAAVTATVFAGSEPAALAISDDGSSLYVGLNGSHSVMRIDPATGNPDAPLYLGASQYSGPRIAGQIAAVPGSASKFVVSRFYTGYSSGFDGLALYDGSTLVGEWSVYTATGGSMAFVSSTMLDTYNNESTGFDLNELTLTSTGFQLDSDTHGLITGFTTTIKGQGGWIFATNGEAVVGSTSQAAGQYATGGQVWPSPDGSNVWFLTSAGTLQDFDRTTFLLNRTFALPSSSGQGTALSLDGLSSTSFVFRTSASVCIVAISP
jgi:DNA-binding beta-propeller fold protein YncE